MELAGECAGRAFINYAFDFRGVGTVYFYPWAPAGFENIREQPETVSGVLTYIRIPKYSNLPVAILSFQNILIMVRSIFSGWFCIIWLLSPQAY
jgi:hypothetical protein